MLFCFRTLISKLMLDWWIAFAVFQDSDAAIRSNSSIGWILCCIQKGWFLQVSIWCILVQPFQSIPLSVARNFGGRSHKWGNDWAFQVASLLFQRRRFFDRRFDAVLLMLDWWCANWIFLFSNAFFPLFSNALFLVMNCLNILALLFVCWFSFIYAAGG